MLSSWCSVGLVSVFKRVESGLALRDDVSGRRNSTTLKLLSGKYEEDDDDKRGKKE